MTDPHPTLLVFEDDPAILNMLRRFLSSQGARVVTAAHGKDGLALIRATRPDLLLLDVIMPFKDGLSLLAELRGEDRDLPVILLTDRDRVEDKVKGLELGADDYLTKPFSLQELQARIRAQLRRSGAGQQRKTGAILVGPLTIDPAAREVQLGSGGSLALTKTEFELLTYLARQPNQVVTHGVLLQEVLGYAPDTETKALVMHIANLRRKLERHCPGGIQIVAVPGVGYRLTPGTAP
ncbi:response regulator transcription factor [Desulfogranum mediterraneum]|uniref:response regulator transcription factor n=1 Tax=Desulfogranum mediterraneum TaxID=160661 RepID=UPI00040FA8CE|nr:response regulator transcription factor [Desulfogranum mediterraneum]